MKKFVCVLCVLGLIPAASVLAGDDEPSRKETKAAEKRAEIDAVAEEALQTLFSRSARAKQLYEKAYGWAVFDNLKIALGISGGGGSGVAVDKGTGARTYMRMGTGGVGLGLGGQKYQVVFLFENERSFGKFVDDGWQADASAKASAGTAGANAKTTFHDGLAVFQLTDKGLMAAADIAGTRYWKSKKLN